MSFNTLGFKIGLGYASMAVVLAGAVVSALWQIGNVTNTSDRIRELRAPTARTSLKMLNSINESNAALRGWTILADPSLKGRRHEIWTDDIYPALAGMSELSESWSNPKNVERLAAIRKQLAEFSNYQQQIEDIAHTPENEPAKAMLVDDVMPSARVIDEAITKIIQIENVQQTTGDRKRLLGVIANLGASTGLAISDLRAFVLTGDQALRRSFDKHWKASATLLSIIQSNHRRLTSEQREAFAHMLTARQELEPLTHQIIEIRTSKHWNEARNLLATKAMLAAKEIQKMLGLMDSSQQQLMEDDFVDNQRQIATLKQVEWCFLVVGLGICIVLATLISRSAILPIRHAVTTAETIAAGNLDCEVIIEGSEEANMLGAALSKMTTNLLVASLASQQQTWLKSGQQELSDAVRGDLDVATVSQRIIAQLAKYLGCEVGIFYVATDDQNLMETANYGIDHDDQRQICVLFGKGLLGQAAADGMQTVLDDLPEDCVRISSGLVETPPKSVIITPVHYNGKVKAVFELGSLSSWEEKQFQLLDLVAEDIAIAISAAQNREQTRNSEQRIQAIVDAAVDPIVSVREDGAIDAFNPAAERLFGYSEKEILGRDIGIIIPKPFYEEAEEETVQDLNEDKTQLLGASREALAKKKDGNIVPILLSVSKIVIRNENDSKQTSLLFTGIIRDLTNQKRAEEELERTHEELLQVSRSAGMSEIATGVLHNVGNVLNSVNVSANLISETIHKSRVHELKKAGEVVAEHTDNMANFVTNHPQGKHMADYVIEIGKHLAKEQDGMVEELVDLRKNIEHIKEIVAMQQSYARKSDVIKEVSPQQLFEDALRMRSESFERHHIEVIREYEEVPPITVERHKVVQILVNLLSNAGHAITDHCSTGGALTLWLSPVTGNCVRFAVTDSGVGISKEHLTKIFNYGFTTKTDGHGFGLHSSALAAKEMGGTLTVHSEGEGMGATFALEIPVQQEAYCEATT